MNVPGDMDEFGDNTSNLQGGAFNRATNGDVTHRTFSRAWLAPNGLDKRLLQHVLATPFMRRLIGRGSGGMPAELEYRRQEIGQLASRATIRLDSPRRCH
jgi:hypothetical protein